MTIYLDLAGAHKRVTEETGWDPNRLNLWINSSTQRGYFHGLYTPPGISGAVEFDYEKIIKYDGQVILGLEIVVTVLKQSELFAEAQHIALTTGPL